jgi:predicted transcriptional regulator
VTNLRAQRNALKISQIRLARLSGVSRFKICTYEVGDGLLTSDEQARISEALRAEADRLRNVTLPIAFCRPENPAQKVSGD